MDIFSVFQLLGGLAFFLFGMNIMGDSLEKLGGGKLEKTLEKLTSGVLKGVLLGAGVTAVIQSSSATTVMVVGFVNSGIMQLGQAVGVIMGANIGTTITAWLLSLTGIQGDSLVMQLMKPVNFSPLLAFIGIVLLMAGNKQKNKDIGHILIGFAVLMFGMETMSGAVKPLANEPWFSDLFLTFSNNPLLGIVAGAVLTAIIQSSSASVGILQALSATGSVTFASAFPIVLGQNIGTCATALISCIGAKKNAKRAALVHLYFNVLGVVVISALFYSINAFVQLDFVTKSINAAGIAVIHTIFNVAATLILLPFNKLIVKIAEKTVKEDKFDRSVPFLDPRFLNAPSVAVEQASKLTMEMADIAKDVINKAFSCIENYDEKLAEKIIDGEKKADVYEDVIGSYLVRLGNKNLSDKDSHEITRILHSIGDFERISDHSVNILRAAKEMQEKNVKFSEGAMAELKVLTSAVTEILDITVNAVGARDIDLAACVEPLEQVIDDLKIKLKAHHVERLQQGDCTIELGFIFNDLVTNAERVSDHCSNVAVCMIETAKNSLDTHEYLKEVRETMPQYMQKYRGYKEQYKLPVFVHKTEQ
ncbi:MAG: Na/Pi cotransporter family protein [Acutalibacteraceae bacterium]